jgi:hypothetical protein
VVDVGTGKASVLMWTNQSEGRKNKDSQKILGPLKGSQWRIKKNTNKEKFKVCGF